MRVDLWRMLVRTCLMDEIADRCVSALHVLHNLSHYLRWLEDQRKEPLANISGLGFRRGQMPSACHLVVAVEVQLEKLQLVHVCPGSNQRGYVLLVHVPHGSSTQYCHILPLILNFPGRRNSIGPPWVWPPKMCWTQGRLGICNILQQRDTYTNIYKSVASDWCFSHDRRFRDRAISFCQADTTLKHVGMSVW